MTSTPTPSRDNETGAKPAMTLREIREALGHTVTSAAVLASTRQSTCHAAVCTVPDCGYVLDEEENEERHYSTPQQAYDDALNFTWTLDSRGCLICPAEDDEHDAARKPIAPSGPQPGPGQTSIADISASGVSR